MNKDPSPPSRESRPRGFAIATFNSPLLPVTIGSRLGHHDDLRKTTALPPRSGNPFVSGHHHQANPCDGTGAQPELYHEYGADVCPPVNSIADNGHCPFTWDDKPRFQDPDCAKYCQVRTNFFWGQEKPFANTYCTGPQVCRIMEQTRIVTSTPSSSLLPQYTAALAAGISGTLSTAAATATARASVMELDDSQCGYFAFVPVIHESCGSLTTAPRAYESETAMDACSDEVDKWSTRENYCASQLRRSADGSADGDTIFVRTDCGTGLPLAVAEQGGVYGEPGVALPRHAQEEWARVFAEEGGGGQGGALEVEL